MPVEYSVVIPVYDEALSLRPLFQEITDVMTRLKKPYEIIFVNDCSSDESLEILKEFKREDSEDSARVHLISLMERNGQTIAMRKGLETAQGKIVITLDADLQNDPADIPKLIEKINGGFDVACGWRKERQDTFLKAILSKTGNVLRAAFTGTNIHDISCTLRAYRRECVSDIPLNWEGQHRFIPLCLSMQGYSVAEVVSNHRSRRFGESKYTHARIFKVIYDFFRILASRGRC